MSKVRKVRKMRGQRTHGWGSKKKHRGGGSRGGRGFAGGHKHHYIKMLKYYPDHFGKKGFSSLSDKIKIININDMLKIAKGNEINLTEMGYDKLLSKGKIDRAVTVTVNKCSSNAREKIEKAGGKVITK